jgi:phosphotransferase system enzyme I (PtsI)
LQAHLLLLDDVLLVDATKYLIESRKINAEWALSIISDDMKEQMSKLEDEYLKERSQDIEFVTSRILRDLLGHDQDIVTQLQNSGECIIIATELSPAETAQLVHGPIQAFATEEGTRTSHTAIMAQALGIPAVVGVSNLTEHINPGDLVIVDGLEGMLIIRPNSETLNRYREKANQWQLMESRLRSTKDDPSVTLDGDNIVLNSNIELPAEAPFALDYGADGIGLYRTEFLYLDRKDPPSLDEQIKVYASVIKTMAPKPVIFRTFDLGVDKMPVGMHFKDKNPALGMRAIRLGLKNPALMKTQLKAILEAAALEKGEAKIMFPMISGVRELRQMKELLDESKKEVKSDLPDIKVGCMIELPAAVFVSDLLAKEADFFSIGTNDLIQYSIAIDRNNDDVAYLYSPYHPSILRAMKMVVDSAQKENIPVAVCGSAAGEPHMTPLLLGMGIRELSMAPNSIPFIKAAIRTLNTKETEDLFEKAIGYTTAEEIETLAVKFMQGRPIV